jgi:hypothetical protein
VADSASSLPLLTAPPSPAAAASPAFVPGRSGDLFHAAEMAMRQVADELHDRTIVLGERRPWKPGGAGRA